MNTFVIAEAGVNHNGSMEIAEKLVDAAVESGCDAVKFQNFKASNLVRADAPKALYQKTNSPDKTETQFQMLRKLELSRSQTRALKNYCEERQIAFLSSPFDIDSAAYLAKLGMSIFKIPSGEITNLPYLKYINSLGRKVILSTGMSTNADIAAALEILKDCDVSLLHCTTEYPCPYDSVNLRAMQSMRARFKRDVGYSDHTSGLEVSIAAVALGASIIEKHFTLSRGMEGPDHRASLEPSELKNLVSSIRNIEKALGNGRKIPSAVEIKNLSIARKSIVAAKRIKSGELLTESNLTSKRPAFGLSPMLWDEVIGTRAKRNFEKDDFIEL